MAHGTLPTHRPCGSPRVTLANPSGFTPTAFGAIIGHDHEVPPISLRSLCASRSRAR
jgi:hypothetical protein